MTNARDKANIPVLNFQSKGIDDNADATAITIDSSERVGIGNSSPTGALDVKSSTQPQLKVATASATAERNAGFLVTANNSATAGSRYLKLSLDADGGDGSGTDNLTITKTGGSGDVTITNESNANIVFGTNNTEIMRLTSTGLGIGTSNPTHDLTVDGGTSSNIALIKDATGSATVRYYDGGSQKAYIQLTSSEDMDFFAASGVDQIFYGNGAEVMRLSSGAVFNENGGNRDFRVESNNNANMLFVDGGNDRVGIGTSSPDYSLEVAGTGLFGGSVMATGSTTTTASRRAIMTHDGSSMKLMASGDSTHRNIIFYRDGGSDEAMRINTSNLVGIGTSSPSEKLQVNGHIASNGIHFVNNTQSPPSGATIHQPASNVMAFRTNNTERMRITSNGNVLFSTTSTPDTVVGASGAGMAYEANGFLGIARIGATLILNRRNTHGDNAVFRYDGNTTGSISVTSNTTAYNTSSDYRLKENVSYDFDATTRLKQLKPARFNFISDADKTVDGFLAHEVSSIVPEAINGTKDAVDEDGNPEYQGIDQSKLVPLLVKTIQELEARITTLEANNP